jgi:hypothetical protein
VIVAGLTDLILAQFTPALSRQISSQLGVDQQTVQRAIAVAAPLLLAALARNASSRQGAQSLSSALEQDHDGSILNDVPGAVSNYQEQPGEGILRHVLGEQRGEVSSALTQGTGADGAAILQMLAPIVMGVLGDTQRQQQLDPNSLASTLNQEREQLAQTGGGLPGLTPREASAPRQQDDVISDLLSQFLR